MPYTGDSNITPNDVVQFFQTQEEMLAELARQRAAANQAVQPWQRAIAPGSHYLSNYFDILIYNEVLEEAAADSDTPLETVERFIRGYSEIEPDGEYGYAHIATAIRPLTQAQFEKARALGWPSSERVLVQILLASA